MVKFDTVRLWRCYEDGKEIDDESEDNLVPREKTIQRTRLSFLLKDLQSVEEIKKSIWEYDKPRCYICIGKYCYILEESYDRMNQVWSDFLSTSNVFKHN